jgi:hypothetical protein
MASIVMGDEGAGHIISEKAKQVIGGLFGKKRMNHCLMLQRPVRYGSYNYQPGY